MLRKLISVTCKQKCNGHDCYSHKDTGCSYIQKNYQAEAEGEVEKGRERGRRKKERTEKQEVTPWEERSRKCRTIGKMG